ncbi:MAG: DUF2892 domain-containing protein [Thermoflexus sp.]|nr:DUF2892 domain-containing protein [Thermoflexus sp.]
MNIAGWDRIVRLIVAVVFILTSLVGWRPLYPVLGFRTKR